MDNQPYSILLVDDHSIVRDGLRALIEHWEDFHVIGEAVNGLEAVQFCRNQVPHIILMDINMPVLDGIAATRQILDEYPSTRIVILTMSVDEKDLFEAIRAGAQGYVLKDIHARQLHNALRGVLIGESPISGPVAARVLAELAGKQPAQDASVPRWEMVDPLSEREIQILQYLVDGFSNVDIGARLYLSDQTVKKYISIIMDKLNLENRVQVAAYALRKGLAK